MLIKKGLNNNVAFVVDDKGNNLIVTGTGIAFAKHPGDKIDESKINYYFPILPREISEDLAKLLVDIDIKYYAIANDIVDKAQATLKQRLNASIVLALTDHIYGAVSRQQKGIVLKNPLRWEIKRIYPQEFEIGLFGTKLIENFFDLILGTDEAATIALHIVNSESEQQNEYRGYKLGEMVHWISTEVSAYFNRDLSAVTEELYYQRFLTHVRFFIQRVLGNSYNQDASASEALQFLQQSDSTAAACVENVSQKFEEHYNIHISKEERAFLTLHIHNILAHATQSKE